MLASSLLKYPYLALFLLVAACSKCEPERIESLPIPNSDWAAEEWIAACGFGVSGPLEIRATNKKTNEQILVAVSDSPDYTKMSLNQSGNLVITWPNSAVLSDKVKEFGGVKVVYNYLPYDDPQERANWQRFRRNPKDPEAKRWYCENVAAKMDRANRETWSQIIGCDNK